MKINRIFNIVLVILVVLVSVIQLSSGTTSGEIGLKSDVITEDEKPQTDGGLPTVGEKPEEPEPTPTPTPAPTPTPDPEPITGDKELDELAKNILDQIITEDMSKYEQAKAVYDYVDGSIKYSANPDKSSWINGAKEGLGLRQGDCFTYYASSRALLTYLGIENEMVCREGGRGPHWWNLVNCGEGWYHFDATPRYEKMPDFDSFMFTDEQAADYTYNVAYYRGYPAYYAFDGEGLPERATEFSDELLAVKNSGNAEEEAAAEATAEG